MDLDVLYIAASLGAFVAGFTKLWWDNRNLKQRIPQPGEQNRIATLADLEKVSQKMEKTATLADLKKVSQEMEQTYESIAKETTLEFGAQRNELHEEIKELRKNLDQEREQRTAQQIQLSEMTAEIRSIRADLDEEKRLRQTAEKELQSERQMRRELEREMNKTHRRLSEKEGQLEGVMKALKALQNIRIEVAQPPANEQSPPPDGDGLNADGSSEELAINDNDTNEPNETQEQDAA